MHILYIHQHFCTPQGSTGTRSFEFAKKIVQRGHVVTMICGSFQMANTGLTGPFYRGVRKGVVDGINVIEIGVAYSNYDGFLSRVKKFLAFSLKACKYALAIQYDIIFATSTPLTSALPGLLAKIVRRKRYIFEVRDLWPELPKAMGIVKNRFILFLLNWFEKCAYRLADQCIGLSPGIVDGIKAKLPFQHRGKVSLLPNGCDVEFFSSLTKGAMCLKKHENEFIAVFTGAHGRANGLGAVIDAADYLHRRGNQNIRFVFVGNGALKPMLVDRAKGLPNCQFLDPMPKTELRGLLQAADLGLMILADVPEFYFGTSPNKFFDYIASGLPVLVNYPGWLANMIDHYNIGASVKPGCARLFADAVVGLSLLPQTQLQQLKANSRALSQLFARDKISDQLMNLIECEPLSSEVTAHWTFELEA